MCHSPGATAVCMATEPLSVIVQRKSLDRNLTEHARLINNNKYIRLGEARGYALTTRIQRSTPVPSSLTVKSVQAEASQSANSSSVSVKDEVFQVHIPNIVLPFLLLYDTFSALSIYRTTLECVFLFFTCMMHGRWL